MSIDFRVKQFEFAANIRNPDQYKAPADVYPERMKVYRQLFFNNIDSFLSANFPVLRTILTHQQWESLVRDFYAQHRCTTPFFSEIPIEFLDYLQNQRKDSSDFPFMLELAHYEWVEMALSIAMDNAPINNTFPNNLLNHPVQLSPVAWPLAYLYPVHRICPDYLPTTPPSAITFLTAYRDSFDEVHFMEITPTTYQLLHSIQQQPKQTAINHLKEIAKIAGIGLNRAIINGGEQILKELTEKNIVSWL